MTIVDALSYGTSAATFLTALAGAVGAILALRQGQRNHVELNEAKSVAVEQHKATNSRLTELLVKTAESSEAIGRAKGVEEERTRKA